jgi:hypothetical protein
MVGLSTKNKIMYEFYLEIILRFFKKNNRKKQQILFNKQE